MPDLSNWKDFRRGNRNFPSSDVTCWKYPLSQSQFVPINWTFQWNGVHIQIGIWQEIFYFLCFLNETKINSIEPTIICVMNELQYCVASIIEQKISIELKDLSMFAFNIVKQIKRFVETWKGTTYIVHTHFAKHMLTHTKIKWERERERNIWRLKSDCGVN